MSKRIIGNVSQHIASEAQIEDGVVEPQNKERFTDLLTFTVLPSREEIWSRAEKIIMEVQEEGWTTIMVGCAQFFASELERAAERKNIKIVYSFSLRVSEEKVMPDGTVKKIGYFVHQGFIQGRIENTALPLGTLQ